MSFLHIKKVSLSELFWYAFVVIASYACFESVTQMANKQKNIWHNKKGALAGWLLYAIIVVVLIIILILALRFLFNII